MATTIQPPIYRLPDELLLSIARCFRVEKSSTELDPLRNLCLVSKRLYLIARDKLYACAYLPVSCGCHPCVNAVVQLLRTLLQRPELAAKIKGLRCSVVRRSIGKLYREKNFNLTPIREGCFKQLTTLGYHKEDPWWISLVNNIESAYLGVLFTLLPNLKMLEFAIKEHHRGMPTNEPLSALFGTSAAPYSLLVALKGLRDLNAPDISFVRDLQFTNLKRLTIANLNVSMLMRLNGPNSLRGGNQLEELRVGVSIQAIEDIYMKEMGISFHDLFAALGCNKLTTLRIELLYDPEILGTVSRFRIQYLMDQLRSVSSNLRVLEIDLEAESPITDWTWFLSYCEDPIASFERFLLLENLMIPQQFLFTDCENDGVMPIDLPKKLRNIDIVCPDQDILAWVSGFIDLPTSVKSVFLSCRDGVNDPVPMFADPVDSLWWTLSAYHGVEGFLCDGKHGEAMSLVKLFNLNLIFSSEWNEGPEDWHEYSDDEDMEDIEDSEDDQLHLLVDDVD